MTHTYAILDVSKECYAEVRRLLEAAGYEHAFQERPDGEVIDMHGIALRAKVSDTDPAPEPEGAED